MKKVLLSLLLVAGLATTASAQNIQKAFGVRLGWGAELSYQHPFSSNNRLEIDGGLYGFGDKYSNRAFVSGIYQWVNPIQDGFNWYVGFGPQLGIISYKDNYYYDTNKKEYVVGTSSKTDFALAIAGQLGVEYNFPSVPFQISLDWRPSYQIMPNLGNGFMYEGIGLGLRYRF